MHTCLKGLLARCSHVFSFFFIQAALTESVCVAAGGRCVVARDGYYVLSYVMITFGVLLGLWYRVLLPKLEALPLGAWRASKGRKR